MRMALFYSELEESKPLSNNDKQNYMIVCDPELGAVYKITDMKVDASAIPSPAVVIVSKNARVSMVPERNDGYMGCVDSAKMVFFETRDGPKNIMDDYNLKNLSSTDRGRVLNAKAQYDNGTLKITGSRNTNPPQPG